MMMSQRHFIHIKIIRTFIIFTIIHFFIKQNNNDWLLCNVLLFYNDNTAKVCSYTSVNNNNNDIWSSIQIIKREFMVKWDLVTTALTLKWKRMEYLYKIKQIKII
jgi:hypothetical protein